MHRSLQPARIRTWLLGTYASAAVTAVPLAWSCSASQAGPLGGDVVALEDGNVRAEILANMDTGEVVVRTRDKDADEPRPVAAAPMVIGEGEAHVGLEPFPLDTDPPGRCSRFYGQADWMRDHRLRNGWLAQGEAADAPRHEFLCRRCFEAGREHAGAWKAMAVRHRRHRIERGGAPHGGH